MEDSERKVLARGIYDAMKSYESGTDPNITREQKAAEAHKKELEAHSNSRGVPHYDDADKKPGKLDHFLYGKY